MKITNRKEINIERTRSITIRFANRQSLRFCPACQTDAPFLTVDEAAMARQTTSREIYRRVETLELHAAETTDGLLLVCLASLASLNAISNQAQITKQEKNNDSNIL